MSSMTWNIENTRRYQVRINTRLASVRRAEQQEDRNESTANHLPTNYQGIFIHKTSE